MSAAIRLTCLCLVCLCVAACGGSGGAPNDRQQIAKVFNDIYAAMARGDYATACSHMSQREQGLVVANARTDGLNASSCANLLTTLFKRAGVTRAQLAQTFGAGAGARKIDAISVHGSQATITFTEKVRGQTYTETDALVREGGQWKADRILKRSQIS